MATHFKVNQDELDRLRKELGVKNPVNIQGAALRGNTYGRYHWLSRYTIKGKRMDVPHHQISLACDISIELLIETLIHEVVHAKQQEKNHRKGATVKRYEAQASRMAKEVKKMKGRLNRHDRYWTSAIEVEARDVAAKLAPSYPKLLAPVPTRVYMVTDKYDRQRFIVVGARSPQAAAAKVASRRWGDSRLARDLSVNVLPKGDDYRTRAEMCGAKIIKWRPGR